MTPKVPISDDRHGDAGDDGGAQTFRRNRKTTSIDQADRDQQRDSTSCTEARIVVVLVEDRSTASMAGGHRARAAAAAASRMRSTVSMMLAPGWRKMMRSDRGSPLRNRAGAQVFDGVDARRPRRPDGRARRCARRRSAARTPRRRSSWSRGVDLPGAVGRRASWPLGRLALALARTARTSLEADAVAVERVGLSSTRTAGSELPPTNDLSDAFDLRRASAAGSWRRRRTSAPVSTVVEVSARIMIGASAGFTLR